VARIDTKRRVPVRPLTFPAAAGFFLIALAAGIATPAPARAVDREQALTLVDRGEGLPEPWSLEDLSVEPGQIVYRFHAPDVGSISVVVEARDPARPAFASTRNLNISYSVPPQGLDEHQEMAVGRFMKELARTVERNDTAPMLPVSASPVSAGGARPPAAPDGRAGKDGVNYGGVAVRGTSAAGLLVVDVVLWLLALAGLVVVTRIVVREVAGWGRPVALSVLALLALSALLRCLFVPYVPVQVGMGHPVLASAVTLDELPRYGAAGPLLYHALFALFPPGMNSVLWLHTLLSLCNALLITTWFFRHAAGAPPGMARCDHAAGAPRPRSGQDNPAGGLRPDPSHLAPARQARFGQDNPAGGLRPDPSAGEAPLASAGPSPLRPLAFPSGGSYSSYLSYSSYPSHVSPAAPGPHPLLSVAFLAFTPLFLRDGNSESLLVPAVFLLFSGALLVQEYLRGLTAPGTTCAERSAGSTGDADCEASAPGHGAGAAAHLSRSGRWLLLAASVPLLALGSHFRPELLLVAPLLLLVTVIPHLRRDRSLLPLLVPAALLLLLAVPYARFIVQAVSAEASRGNLSADRFLPHVMLFDWMWRNLFWRPLFFPAGMTVLTVVALALAGFTRKGVRDLLPVTLLAVVWMALYHVDFNDESMLRLHVPGMMLMTLVAAAGVQALVDRFPGRGRILAVAAPLLAAATAVPTAGFVFFRTNYQAQDRLFPEMMAALPEGQINLVALTGRDEPSRAWSDASLAENPSREGAPPVHRFFGSYLLEPPLRDHRVMALTEFRERPDWTRRTFFFLGVQCYAMRESFGYEEWGVEPDPLRLLHPGCRWMMTRHVLMPVKVFRIPNEGEFASPFQWYPPSLAGMTIGLFEVKPGEVARKSVRDSFTTIAGEYFSMARKPLLDGDFAEARRILLAADELLVDSTELWDSISSTFFLEGARKDDPEPLRASLDYLLRIADRDIHHPELLKGIASVHATLKRYLTPEEDARYVDDRLARDPDDLVGLWLQAVRLFYTHEHYEDSLVLLNRILERVSDDPRVYVYIALDHFYLGRQAEAEAAVQKAIDVAAGSDPDAYYVRSILVRRQDLDLAVRDIERYLDMSEGADKVRNELKQKWLRKEVENLRLGRPSLWWKGGGHDEPWTRLPPE